MGVCGESNWRLGADSVVTAAVFQQIITFLSLHSLLFMFCFPPLTYILIVINTLSTPHTNTTAAQQQILLLVDTRAHNNAKHYVSGGGQACLACLPLSQAPPQQHTEQALLAECLGAAGGAGRGAGDSGRARNSHLGFCMQQSVRREQQSKDMQRGMLLCTPNTWGAQLVPAASSLLSFAPSHHPPAPVQHSLTHTHKPPKHTQT